MNKMMKLFTIGLKVYSKDGYDDDNKPLYINFESKEHYNEEEMRRLFGRNLERLKELKRKYGPNVLFSRRGAIIWHNDKLLG